MIRVGLIGYGYWGPNLLRNFSEVAGCEPVALSDLSSERLAAAQARYPSLRVTQDARDLLHDPSIDAIAIATPVSTHFDLANAALRAGKHVLVEKPLATTSEDAQRLIEEAEKRHRVLLVDHTFVYTGAVRKIKELVSDDQLGQLYYYDAVRINLGLFQHDVNVLWDLAVHDLSIMSYVLGTEPTAVAATAVAHVPAQPENTAYLTCFFPHNLIAHLHVNWLAPVKIRRTLISGAARMIVYDDLEPSEKIRVYDRGITLEQSANSLHQVLTGYRIGDMWAPRVDLTEALRTEVQELVRCIETGARPISDGQAGLQVVRILEAAARSLQEQGRPVDLREPAPA